MKSLKLLASFGWYCVKNPKQRFWQALRNWSDAGAIIWTTDPLWGKGCPKCMSETPDFSVMSVDTYYWDDKN